MSVWTVWCGSGALNTSTMVLKWFAVLWHQQFASTTVELVADLESWRDSQSLVENPQDRHPLPKTIKGRGNLICKRQQKERNAVKVNRFCVLAGKKLSEKLKEWLMKQGASKMILPRHQSESLRSSMRSMRMLIWSLQCCYPVSQHVCYCTEHKLLVFTTITLYGSSYLTFAVRLLHVIVRDRRLWVFLFGIRFVPNSLSRQL